MPLQAVDTGFDSPHSSDERFFTPRHTPPTGSYLSSGDEWSKTSGRGYGSNSESDHYETPRHGYSSDGSQNSESYYHCPAKHGGADYYTTPFVANGGHNGGHPSRAAPLRRKNTQAELPRQNARPVATAWAAESQANAYSSDDSGYASQEYAYASQSYDKDDRTSTEYHGNQTVGDHSHQSYGCYDQSWSSDQSWSAEHTASSSWGQKQYIDPAAAAHSAPTSHERQVDELYSLARHGRVQEVQQYLESGFPANSRDKNGNTILSIACQNGNKRVAKAALRHGADINSQNDKGNTPLHFCFSYGFGETLGAYLVSKGADTTVRNRGGLTCYEGIAAVTHAPRTHGRGHGQPCY
jgi:hypothetical protein